MENRNFIYHLIVLDYTNELNEQQREVLQAWLELSETNKSEYNEIKKLLTYYNRLGAMKKINIDRDLILVKKKLKQQSKSNTLFQNLQRVAAILILPLLIYTVWTISDASKSSNENLVMKSSETAFGVRSQILLGDGTKVWLNSGSKLTYPADFKGDTREVKLTGEAYFQVESDKNYPFYVDLNGYKVKVTGTRFNISNYPENKEIITYLEQGKVTFLTYTNAKQNELTQLKEKEIIILNKAEKQYRILNADGKKYLAWIDGLLIFKNDNIHDVATRLGRWFNAEIIFDNELSDSNYIFTATFKQESLEEALNLLSYSTPITYKIISSTKQDDSSFSTRKVIISKK